MAGFLIFIPAKNFREQTDDSIPHPLAQVGLGTLVEGADMVGLPKGPDGGKGVLFGWRKPGNQNIHFEDPDKNPTTTQEWVQSAKNGEMPMGTYWVGVWKDKLPTPQDLVRRFPRRGVVRPLGKEQRLGDSDVWHIPSLNDIPRTTNLNFETGGYDYIYASEYAQLVVEIHEWIFYLADSSRWTPACEYRMIDFLIRVLGVNYLMTKEVACHFLNLFYAEEIVPLIAVVAGLSGLDVEIDIPAESTV